MCYSVDPATQRRALPIEDGHTDPVATEPLLIPGCLRDGTRIIEPVAPDLVEPGPVVPEGSGAAVPATDPVDHPEQSDNSNNGAADTPPVPDTPRRSERQSGKRHEVVL